MRARVLHADKPFVAERSGQFGGIGLRFFFKIGAHNGIHIVERAHANGYLHAAVQHFSGGIGNELFYKPIVYGASVLHRSDKRAVRIKKRFNDSEAQIVYAHFETENLFFFFRCFHNGCTERRKIVAEF